MSHGVMTLSALFWGAVIGGVVSLVTSIPVLAAVPILVVTFFVLAELLYRNRDKLSDDRLEQVEQRMD